MSRRSISSEFPRSDLEQAVDDRELHEDFKRLAQLSAPRPLAAPVEATLRSATGIVAATCIEVSNDGLGLLVPAWLQLTRGDALELEGLRRGTELLMQDVWCDVERVSPVENTEVMFVSVTFQRRSQSSGSPLRITNTLRVRAVIDAASTKGVQFSVELSPGSKPQKFSSGKLDGDRLVLVPRPGLSTLPPRLELLSGQVVTVGFQLPLSKPGKEVLGHASVLSARRDALVLSLPTALLERTPRLELRALTFRDQASISFISPLSGLRRTRSVLELSATAVSFKVDPADVFPPGLQLSDVVLEVRQQKLHASAIVTSVGNLEFTAMAPVDRQRLLDLLIPSRLDGARCGGVQVPFGQIWRLFEEEGALFRDHWQAPIQAQTLLGDGAHGLSKTIAVVRDGELVAHSSGLRIYSRTWLAQHLMVKSGFHRAGTLAQQTMALSYEYGEALPEVDFVRALFRVSNSSAERIYSSVSDRLLKPGLAYRVRYEPMRLHVQRAPLMDALASEPGLRVRAARPDDERDFLAFAGRSEDPVKLLSDDLVPGELRLQRVSRRFEALGLVRRRSLAVVEDGHGAPLGWTLMETMSEGLVWTEQFNSFRLFLVDPTGPLASHARAALAGYATRLAAMHGRHEAECHAAPEDVADLELLGFSRQGAVYEFGAHRSVVAEFTQQMNAVLARLQRRGDKGEPKHPEPGLVFQDY